ncbi:RluA family pseudouridine synthase [Roseovarius sp. D0-M9]|uniref:RluA family pseudouridine synthase n=1 Tax=Roseovarius sp. D0-M9 TaxID=3127117 RepID=UPI0030104EAA
MASTSLTLRIGMDPPPRLDKALARDVPPDAALSRTRLARLIEDGQVRINGAVVTDAKARVQMDDEVAITVPVAEDTHILPEDIALDILYEDADLLVVNKPAGMVVHPAPGTPGGTLVNALLHHFGGDLSGVGGQKRPGIVHRIDKDTSGLLVVAKSDAAHHGLAEQFAKHTAQRRYIALCHGTPEASDPRLRGLRGVTFEPGNILRITSHLARHRTDRQKQAVCWAGGRHAVTRARPVQRFGTPGACALMECWLETGRTHQIRVHMAYAGHGLIGDPVYGAGRKLAQKALPPVGAAMAQGFGRQALHAASLGFVHPLTDEELTFEAPLPEDMTALIAALTPDPEPSTVA